MLPVGTQAPDFNVKDHNGNDVSLKNFKGKKVVLWFYPKADTPGCTMEGKGFRDDYEKFRAKDVVILGVSLDGVSGNRAFAEKFSFPYPLLCDENKDLALTYHAVKSRDDGYASRITYVIGEDGKILEAIEKVDTKSHSSDLCSRL
ncbi:MAG: peroxiredoxin [Nitrospinae bacterium CG11_big_fil_rev_8_21_14_0_20_56_8]|nr:MAG: peroxiredoxin [Nitrospinae bacterium CG11_big_fil_rev_8_21_14_0_20_56_8]